MRQNRLKVIILVIAALVIGIVGGGYVGMNWSKKDSIKEDSFETVFEDDDNTKDASKNKSSNETAQQELRKIEQAKELIQKHYVEEVDDKKLTEGAIKGMLETLDDPYSSYLDVEMMKEFDEQIESSFEGIGAEVSMENNKVTIVAPIKGSPAEKVGLKPNDKILEIGGKSIEGLDLNEAVDKIRGKKGSKVKLKIERPSVKKPFEVEITRDEIPIETIYAETKKEDGHSTGIIKITSFSEHTSEDFMKELKKMEDSKIDGLVIDVRGNPGGLLDSVEDMLKEFVPKDKPYLQIEDRKGNKEPHYSDLTKKKSYPVTVLTDEGSASASEILAIALKETGYDTVGTKTYGKGTVQQAVPLDDESTVKLTLYKWLSPKGTWIHKKGVEPSVEVKQPKYFYSHPIQIEDSLKYDETSEDIANIQVMLKGLGFDSGREDGYFDKQTEKSVKAFQKKNKLKETGIIDEKTAGVIETKILEKVRDGKDDKQLEKAIDVLYK